MSKGGGSSSASGYAALSKPLKQAFDPFGQAINQYTLPSNEGVLEMFTPMAQTGDETNALNMMRQGFAPTQESLTSDIAMQMNPYNSFVIDEINRQSGGQYSLLGQAMNEAGQMGSNRQMLGANDIDLSRTNQIGGFLQNQYNTAMGNAMTTLPGLRQQDAQNLLGVGSFERSLDELTRQAPLTALQAGTNLMAPFLSGSTSSNKQGSDIAGTIGGVGGLLTGLAAFSDRSLKENIVNIGQENGHNVYEFNYINDDKKYIGVMADEVEKTNPDAVMEIDGFKAVDYAKIGVEFREA